jgi:type III pantothenate kinase
MHDREVEGGRAILGVCVGNTRVRLGLFAGRELGGASSVPVDDIDAIVRTARDACGAHDEPVVVLASVNEPDAQRLERALTKEFGQTHRFGRDIPIPLRHRLDDASTLGQDRALCALGAYTRAEQACVVIDAGTAITVDFIDGEGVYQGGAIAPGLRMMLRALREQTSALPEVTLETPDPARGPFGRDTPHAMLLGVRAAAVGLVHHLVERYALHYEAYPQIVATGGDAPSLFEHDEVVEHIVPDLQLIGLYEACKAAAEPDDEPDNEGHA